MTAAPRSVPLRFHTSESPVRRGEPVTVGLPWPRGTIHDAACFRLTGPDGSPQVLQTQILDRWPDGSVRWCLFDFFATVDGTYDDYRIEIAGPEPSHPPSPFSHVVDQGSSLFRVVVDSLEQDVAGVRRVEDGPVRRRLELGLPSIPGLELFGHADVYAGLPVARVQLTIRNPAPADHPGGNWDLGTRGSIDIRSLGIVVAVSDLPAPSGYHVSIERGQPSCEYAAPVMIRQDSSGGPNRRSTNHLTRARQVPPTGSGYQFTVGDIVPTHGGRATPVVCVEGYERFLGVAVPHFWENFPKEVSASPGRVRLALFPDGETELQGGEQKTHVFSIALGRDDVTDSPMAWCRSPLLCYTDPEWYATSGVVPYLTPRAADPNAAYLALVDQAIEGPDTFLSKREVIDEYGWRNFGDLYADHEATRHTGPTPLVSHYNNQYDCVAGFALQFLRSSDPRWWDQMVACADHTCDIDVYHTGGDKPAYNRGLFWHTYHYADADTGTHRAYPRSLRRGPQDSLHQKMDTLGDTAAKLKQSYAVGGGPSASHNYNAGLMLAYFLTGNPLYRDTATDLARFVVAMDDPTRTPFRWLSREFTGLATESGGGGYHGPGRASANSILALLVGHQLTGDRSMLDKAEQLIRRVSHPMQDLAALDLRNAELRWFYTMHLQAIGRYLDYKADLGERDRMYAYARLTLLHYARWMAAHERPILDTPERLQYPTETWAAQDMRKVEVFQYAAKHALGAERCRFLEKADGFFRYVEQTLSASPTRSLCRPVVLMLNFGWSRAWWQSHSEIADPELQLSDTDFGTWSMFVPQKTLALRRAKAIVAAGVVLGLAAIGVLAVYLLS